MSQFVVLQVGQCGNQIGSAFWPLALHEYGIQTNSGGVNLLKSQKNHVKNHDDLSDAFDSFFHVPKNCGDVPFKNVTDLTTSKVKARAVLIDMEDSVVARYKEGPLRGLFDKTCTVTNYPGSANNWAVGFYEHGREYQERLSEAVRICTERCDSLHGFLLVNSLGGGTGSGLGTATLSIVSEEYPNVDRFVAPVYPTGTQDTVTAPYNVLLASHMLTEKSTCVFPVENRALLDICNLQANRKKNVDQANYNALCKPYQDMNSVVVNMLLHLTSGSRFPGSLNTDMNELATNLVPYPRLHYVFSSVSPINLTASTTVPVLNGTKMQDELFTNVWSRGSNLVKIDPLQTGSLVIGAVHVARGCTTLTDVRRNIERFRGKAKFTSWSKDSIKIGLCSTPPAGHPSSLLCLLNSTSMSLMFDDIVKQFDNLYKRKAHVHHYLNVDGFETADFLESRNSAIDIRELYRSIEKQKPLTTSRLQLT